MFSRLYSFQESCRLHGQIFKSRLSPPLKQTALTSKAVVKAGLCCHSISLCGIRLKVEGIMEPKAALPFLQEDAVLPPSEAPLP